MHISITSSRNTTIGRGAEAEARGGAGAGHSAQAGRRGQHQRAAKANHRIGSEVAAACRAGDSNARTYIRTHNTTHHTERGSRRSWRRSFSSSSPEWSKSTSLQSLAALISHAHACARAHTHTHAHTQFKAHTLSHLLIR